MNNPSHRSEEETLNREDPANELAEFQHTAPFSRLEAFSPQGWITGYCVNELRSNHRQYRNNRNLVQF
jgi:hypothetical protein